MDKTMQQIDEQAEVDRIADAVEDGDDDAWEELERYEEEAVLALRRRRH